MRWLREVSTLANEDKTDLIFVGNEVALEGDEMLALEGGWVLKKQ